MTDVQTVVIHSITGKVLMEYPGANLRGAHLQGANLENADLWCADLRNANLTDVNLRHANLQAADLRGADLRNADLTDVNLFGAFLAGANIIHLGQRSDGCDFYASVMKSKLWIKAGCRFYMLSNARSWLTSTRDATPLCNETMALLDHAERMAKIRRMI
jgi:uncharacterized protein YjbI with pentapeptide repeats